MSPLITPLENLGLVGDVWLIALANYGRGRHTVRTVTPWIDPKAEMDYWDRVYFEAVEAFMAWGGK